MPAMSAALGLQEPLTRPSVGCDEIRMRSEGMEVECGKHSGPATQL